MGNKAFRKPAIKASANLLSSATPAQPMSVLNKADLQAKTSNNTTATETVIRRLPSAYADVTISLLDGVQRNQFEVTTFTRGATKWRKNTFPFTAGSGYSLLHKPGMTLEQWSGFCQKSVYEIKIDVNTIKQAAFGTRFTLVECLNTLSPSWKDAIRNLVVVITIPGSEGFLASNRPFNKESPVFKFLTCIVDFLRGMKGLKSLSFIIQDVGRVGSFGTEAQEMCAIPLMACEEFIRFRMKYEQTSNRRGRAVPLYGKQYMKLRRAYQKTVTG